MIPTGGLSSAWRWRASQLELVKAELSDSPAARRGFAFSSLTSTDPEAGDSSDGPIIGIHVGDVVEESDADLMDDGINIAISAVIANFPQGLDLLRPTKAG